MQIEGYMLSVEKGMQIIEIIIYLAVSGSD